MAELKVKLMAHTPNSDAIVAAAAKLCYSPVGVDGIMEKLTDEEVDYVIKQFSRIVKEYI